MRNKIDIHADDYAYSIHTSMDILDCIKQGKLDSFSIICNTDYFEESMDLLYEAIPSLDFLPLISVHLNIPEGESDDDLFPMSWGALFMASYTLKRKRVKAALKKELKHQIDKTQEVIDKCIQIARENGVKTEQQGVRLDSHIHTHSIPVVWDALTEVIDEEDYRIEYIRNPKEPLIPFLKEMPLIFTYGIANIIKNRILMVYSGKVDKYCDRYKLVKMYMWGLTMSGHMDYDRIKKLYPAMAEKAKQDGRVMELLFHPGRALSEEYSREMNKNYFNDANVSLNRTIEKDTVMCIEEIVGEE